jgi:hypothetical protein
MKRKTAATLFFGGAIGLSSIGYALAPPAHSLPLFQHTAQAGFSPATCFESGAWGATLTITATNLELDPQATITVNGQPPMNPVAVPYTHPYTAMAGDSTLTASAHIVWTDGFKQDVGPFIAQRPDGCTPPTTQPGTTTTTTCAMAIPPRGDCEGATTSTPSTSTPPIPTVPGTSPSATTVAVSVPPTSTATTHNASPTSTLRSVPINLPPTGASDILTWIGITALGLIVVGTIALTAKRDRRLRDRT